MSINRTNKPLFSIIINCFNSEKFLKESIESVLNQSLKNFEIIIIDNHSNDNTKLIIDNIDDIRIKYFKTPKFLKLGKARNFGLKKAIGLYVAYLDSDDYWHENKLKKSLKLFNKKTQIVYSDVLYFNDNYSFRLYQKRKIYTGSCFENLMLDYNLCLSSVIFEKKLAEENKIFFDDNLKVCEDFDFFLKLSKFTQIDYIPEILAFYRVHGNNQTLKEKKLFFKETEIIINKHKDISVKLRRRCLDKNTINKAISFWKEGDVKEAYNILSQLKHLRLVNLTYILLFLVPYKIVKRITFYKTVFE